MPLYEYRCQGCDLRFEVLQRMGAGPEGLSCPECGRTRLSREVSSFSSCSRGGAPQAAACGPSGRFT